MTCDRCGGTGRFPSTRFEGVCLKCGGSRKIADRKARKPRAVRSNVPETAGTQTESAEFLLSWMA